MNRRISPPKISARTLVLCGNRDRADPAEAKLAGQAIPSGSFYLVPHVGHTWAVTQPKLFATVIRPFLAVDVAAATDDESASRTCD